STANQLPTSRTRYSPMNPGNPALPPPAPPPAVSPGAGGELSGRGVPAPALVGRPVITSGTPGATALLPTSATTRTTSAMRSGSQAISVRIEKMPTSVHSPGGPGTG